jgi:pimeloyl-ACP methyl ester carboxylesterase
VFLFHGQPGNRLFHPDEETTRRKGVRLIVPDRPGYGLSDFQAGRRLVDWPGDVLSIGDHFGLDKFDVIGFSGGGPYALACAYATPERLGRVCVVSGAPPMHIPELRREMVLAARMNYGLTHYSGPIFGLIFKFYWRQARRNPSGFIELMRKKSPHPDLLLKMMSVWEENLRVDSHGYVQDAQVLMSDWGFGLEGIKVPVELWWGEFDENVPRLVMDYLADRLPECTRRLLPDAGHFAILTGWEQILDG